MTTIKAHVVAKAHSKPLHELPIKTVRDWHARLSYRAPVAAIATDGNAVVFPIKNRDAYIIDSNFLRLYSRIYLLPNTIELGGISTEKTIDFQIWNANLFQCQLTDIKLNNADGIELDLQVPITLNRLMIKTFSLLISMNGPSKIDCQILFYFDSGDEVTLTITGERTVQWTVVPNWSNSFIETLEFDTSVLQSQTGAEQRISRRLSPRRFFEFSVLLDRVKRQQFERYLLNNASRSLSMPVYPDITAILSSVSAGESIIDVQTLGLDFYAGGNALLSSHADLSGKTETVSIADVSDNQLTLASPLQNAWQTGCYLFPLRNVYLTDPPSIRRKNDDVISAELRFSVIEHNAHNNQLDLPIFNGFYVLEHNANWRDDIESKLDWFRCELDNQTGLRYVASTAPGVYEVESHRWTVNGRKEQDQLRSLLYYLNGRQKPIFISSKSTDFNLIRDIDGAFLDVELNNYDKQDINAGRKFLRINCTQLNYYVEVIGVHINDDGSLRLLINQTLILTKNQVIQISFLKLCRLNSDRITWEHLTDSAGTAEINVDFRELRYELE